MSGSRANAEGEPAGQPALLPGAKDLIVVHVEDSIGMSGL